jgi:hypothetical protein
VSELQITLHRLGEHDVTDAVRKLYDLVTSSMDWGSGFLDDDEVLAVRKFAMLAGFDDIEYQSDPCTCGHTRTQHSTMGCYWRTRPDLQRDCNCQGFVLAEPSAEQS